MKLKALVATGLVTLMAQGTALAYDIMWFDRNAGIDTFRKVMVYPMAEGSRYNFFPDSNGKFGKYNYELHKRLTRHAKGITYYELFDGIDEKEKMGSAVSKADRDKLLMKFPSEKDRAAAIFDASGADGYIVPYFRQRNTITDYSPAAYVTIRVKSYTEVRDAPNRNYDGTTSYTKDERYWDETVYVPEAYLTRYVTALEFTMFNEEGNKVFTCLNRRHSYSRDFDDEYKDMKDDFADDLKDIKKNKEVMKHHEKNKSTLKLKIGNLSLPSNVGNDEYKLKSCWYLFKTHALRMKNMKVVEGSDASTAQYYVDGSISRYDFTPQWVAPYATSSDRIAWSKEQKWRDKNNKEHTMVTTHYEPQVTPHHGYYSFDSAASVGADLTMYDARTGKAVLSKSYYETDDKEVDCLTHIMKDFFNKADKYAKKQMK